MKKLMIALLATGYCYGMDIQTENGSQLGNSLLTEVGESNSNTAVNTGSSGSLGVSSASSIIDNSQSLKTEWKVWDVMARIVSPLQIVVSSGNAFLGGVASAMANNKPDVTQKLVIASTVLSATSVLFEIFLSKMEQRNKNIGQALTGAASQTKAPTEAL